MSYLLERNFLPYVPEGIAVVSPASLIFPDPKTQFVKVGMNFIDICRDETDREREKTNSATQLIADRAKEHTPRDKLGQKARQSSHDV